VTGAHDRALAAQANLDAAHARLVRSAAPIRASLRRHPAAWLIGGGFTVGLVAGLLPTQRWLRTGISLASTGMRLMTPFLAGIEAARSAPAVVTDADSA